MSRCTEEQWKTCIQCRLHVREQVEHLLALRAGQFKGYMRSKEKLAGNLKHNREQVFHLLVFRAVAGPEPWAADLVVEFGAG